MIQPWKSVNQFPKSQESWSVFTPILNRVKHGEERVRRTFNRPNLLEPALVATPATLGRYLPPLALEDEDGDLARAHVLKDRGKMKVIALVYLPVITGVLWYIAGIRAGAAWFSFSLVTLGYLHFDTESLGRVDAMQDRAFWYGWMYCHARPYLVAAVACFSLMGAMQLALISYLGSNTLTLEKFGLLYSAVTSHGEWWRLLTGPFLHYSAAHWLGNFMIGVGLFTLCGPLLTGRLWPLLLTSAVGSFAAVYAGHCLGLNLGDGIIGLSGGLGSLLGWLVASAMRFPRYYPNRFFLTAGYFALVTLILMPIFTSVGTLICHVSGMGLGAAFAMISGKPSFARGNVP